jgi:hypothetical protein
MGGALLGRAALGRGASRGLSRLVASQTVDQEPGGGCGQGQPERVGVALDAGHQIGW